MGDIIHYPNVELARNLKHQNSSDNIDDRCHIFSNLKNNRNKNRYFTRFHLTNRLRFIIKRIFSKDKSDLSDRNEVYKQLSVNAIKLLNEDLENGSEINLESRAVIEKCQLATELISQYDKASNQSDEDTVLSSSISNEIKRLLPNFNATAASKEKIIRQLCSALSEKLNDEVKAKKEKQLTISSNVQNICIESANNNAFTQQNLSPQNSLNIFSNIEIIKELSHLKNDISDLKLQNINLITKALQLHKIQISNNLKTKKENLEKVICDNKFSQCEHTVSVHSKELKNETPTYSIQKDNPKTDNRSFTQSFDDINDISNEISNHTPSELDQTNITDKLFTVIDNENLTFLTSNPENKTSSITIEYKIQNPHQYPTRKYRREFVQSIIQNENLSKSLSTVNSQNHLSENQKNKITYDTLGIDDAFSIVNRKCHVPVHPCNIDVGDIVRFSRETCRVCLGIVKFIGDLPNQKDIFLGLKLERDDGLNDGTYNGQRYFEWKICKKTHFSTMENLFLKILLKLVPTLLLVDNVYSCIESTECVFPFYYNGECFDTCTSYYKGKSWCGLKTDVYGGWWKTCDEKDDKIKTSLCQRHFNK